MRKTIVLLVALTALSFVVPSLMQAEVIGSFDTAQMEEYKGNIDDPQVLIVMRGDIHVIVKVNGHYYFYRAK